MKELHIYISDIYRVYGKVNFFMINDFVFSPTIFSANNEY